MEIGSIYEINPASLEGCVYESLKKPALHELDEIKKYNKRYCEYTASGREAIALALRSLGNSRRDLRKRCLLPAYMCDTVFFPFEREGWEIHFYHVNKKLEVSEDELRVLIERLKPGLIFIHPYYGVDTWKAVRPMLAKLQMQGICIMEDVTQSYYLGEVGAEADYVVGSLRKWYPVPDGGFVAADERLAYEGAGESIGEDIEESIGKDIEDDVEESIGEDTEESVEESIGEAAEDDVEESIREDEEDIKEYDRRRLKVLMDKWEYLHGKQDAEEKKLSKAAYLKQNRELEEELDRYPGVRNISDETAYILNRINEEDARCRRRANYKYLSDRLQGKAQFVPIMPDAGKKAGDMENERAVCQAETAPLYFAIYVKERDELQSFLSERGIYAPVLWPVGKENGDLLTEDERYIYGHMLALPMDQRYGEGEMRRIVEVMEEYERQKGCGYQEKQCHKSDKAAGNARIDIKVQADVQVNEGEVIGIRADANETVAMGHIMRCITIAGQLRKLGNKVIFFTADEYASEILGQAGLEQVCLHSDWKHLDEEVPILREELKKRGCRKLLVDSYYASAEYFEGLSDLCKLIYIDDCFEGIYPVDMLVNYNAYHVRFNYEEAYRGKTKLLLGTAYVPLREEFGGGRPVGEVSSSVNSAACPPCDSCSPLGKVSPSADFADATASEQAFGRLGKVSPESPHVLISSGGGDAYNALAGILGGIIKDKEMDKFIVHTVVGGFNPNAKELEELAEGNPNIRLHYGVSNMAELMAQCSAAVSAAGTMLFELSAMELPSVFFVCADNQQYDSEFFAQKERMLFAGDIRSDRMGCIENICSSLKNILKDENLRQRMKNALRKVTDGRGAERIAGAIEEL